MTALTSSVGAAFLAVYYTKLTNLFASAEDLWEAVFSLIAALMIFVVCVTAVTTRVDPNSGVTMLQMDRAKAKWRVKLGEAFAERVGGAELADGHKPAGRGTKCALAC